MIHLSAVFVTAVDKENSPKTPPTLSHIYICICICICSPWTPRTLCWCCLSALSRECLQSRLFQASKTEEGIYFISSRNVKWFISNTSKQCSTIWQYDTWTAVLKNSTIVLSRFRNESKRWKTIFSWVVGKMWKKKQQKEGFASELANIWQKSESNQQKDQFAPEIPNIWPLSLGPYNTRVGLSCTPIYVLYKISFNKMGQRGVMSI